MKGELTPQQAWDLYNETFPDSILTLDHIGIETKALFVHSPVTNGRDEHTSHLTKWMWEEKSRWRIGVGVMKYDNFKLKDTPIEPEATVEIFIDPAIKASVPIGEDTKND